MAAGSAGENMEELYLQAVKVVMRDKKCSTSYIQRRLGIGYNKAATLVERMEAEGIVGPANHVGKREILLKVNWSIAIDSQRREVKSDSTPENSEIGQ